MKVIYKKIIYLLFLFPTILFSQLEDSICGTQDITYNPTGVYSYSTDPSTLAVFEPVVYNIYFWGINKASGQRDDVLTEDEVLEVVANLNIVYNEFNVFFKYLGFEFFNSDEVYIPSSLGGILSYAQTHDKIKENSFNVYIPYRFSSGISGVSNPNSTNLAINSANINSSPLPVHEIGHNFNLAHTHYSWRSPSTCEHVTRDKYLPDGTLNGDYNANEAGDFVTDTAAVPNFAKEHYWELRDAGLTHEQAEAIDILNKYIDPETCQYTGTGDDCLEMPRPYEILPEDVLNFLSYGGCDIQDRVLTTGQGIRVRESIADDIYSNFEDAETTIPALYEPYVGSYPEYYPHPLPWEYPKFQPGFEYRFVACGGDGDYPQPADYNDISFPSDNTDILLNIGKYETNYSTITHPNHSAIGIKHEIGNVFWPQARKCYDNYNSPDIIGGVVIKFNDNVINANVTITPQDSTAINQPNLIEDLENGLYKIEKNYEGGTSDETIIIKENN